MRRIIEAGNREFDPHQLAIEYAGTNGIGKRLDFRTILIGLRGVFGSSLTASDLGASGMRSPGRSPG